MLNIGLNQYESDTWCSLSGDFFPFLGLMEYKENVLVWASERELWKLFQSPLIGWKISAVRFGFMTLGCQNNIDQVRKKDEKLTWNSTRPKMNNTWWSLRFCNGSMQISCLNIKLNKKIWPPRKESANDLKMRLWYFVQYFPIVFLMKAGLFQLCQNHFIICVYWLW